MVFFWSVKFGLDFPTLDAGYVKGVLVATVVLFGFLAGFFYSELKSDIGRNKKLTGSKLELNRSISKVEKLLVLEWFLLWILTLIIAFFILFLDTSSSFAKVISIIVPALVVFSIKVLYELDKVHGAEESAGI